MSAEKQKLELTWVGKSNPQFDFGAIEPRILVEDPSRSVGGTSSRNLVIHGDNLLALKALLPEYQSSIKCVYIDPPYNTGNAYFEHYDDSVEHSLWLALMRTRLEILHRLLRDDGFICTHIDDSEGHYLKVLLDEIFGRSNYLCTIYVLVRYPEKTLKQDMVFHKEIEYIHVYRKTPLGKPRPNLKPKNFDKFIYYVREKAEGRSVELGGKQVRIFHPGEYEIVEGEGSATGLKEIWASGTILDGNSSGRFFRDYLSPRFKDDGLGMLYRVDGIGDDSLPYRYFTGPKKVSATKGKYYQGVPLEQLNNPDAHQATPIENFIDLAGAFGNCRLEGGVEFRSGKKPEILLHTLLKHFSDPGDFVLDSFLGSGSTVAVAHKMGRNYIGIEMGDHAYTHVQPRLTSIVEGKDDSGISALVGWKGGGGFRFFELATSFIVIDEFGNPIIDRYYDGTRLIRAMCKLLNFEFKPSETHYWKHGSAHSSTSLYVTTQFLSTAMVTQISQNLMPDEALVIAARKYEHGCEQIDKRIILKKIPQSVLKACHYGMKEYLLPVVEVEEECEDNV